MTEKKLEDMTAEELQGLKIEFAPGCFDNFDGTQEELDALMAEITRMFRTGEFLEHAQDVDLDNLMEEDPELAMRIISDTPRQTLQ